MNDELARFVRDALAKGLPKQEIRAKLLEARWPEDEVKTALDAFADVDFPVPVPRPRPYLSAKEAFVYLVLFSTLYTSAIGLVQLLFQFIHRAFPDPAANDWVLERSVATVRWWTAAVLIAFPVFLWLSRLTYHAIRRDPEKRTSKIRKWLTYLTLFVAAAVLIGDLITLVFYLLGGELTVRFVLKVLAVGAVAGSVFGYYLWDLGQDDVEPVPAKVRHPGLRWFTLAVIGAVMACLVGGFVVAGSPGRARLERLDDIRQSDLQSIAAAMDTLWRERGELAPTLEALSRERTTSVRSILDPDTGQPYEYRITGEKSYELCAVFDLEEEPKKTSAPQLPGSRFWNHGAGRRCFDLKVSDPPAN